MLLEVPANWSVLVSPSDVTEVSRESGSQAVARLPDVYNMAFCAQDGIYYILLFTSYPLLYLGPLSCGSVVYAF